MNKRVATLRPDQTVAEAVEVLTRHHTGGMPIVNDNGKLVGMISELSLIDLVFDAKVRTKPISAYMTPNVHSLAPNESLSRAAQLFALYSFRRIPVVENDKVVGIVTRRDLMNYALENDVVLNDPLMELVPELVTTA